jgi:hypothetical protein
MIKVKGIEEGKELTWEYDSPPKFYRKVGSKTDSNGNFTMEVFKLKTFNKFSKEAIYVRQKDQKIKAKDPADNFNFATPKNKNKYETY